MVLLCQAAILLLTAEQIAMMATRPYGKVQHYLLMLMAMDTPMAPRLFVMERVCRPATQLPAAELIAMTIVIHLLIIAGQTPGWVTPPNG